MTNQTQHVNIYLMLSCRKLLNLKDFGGIIEMKKIRKSILFLLLISILVSLFTNIAYATETTQDGLRTEIILEKENYSKNEIIPVKIIVTNTNDYDVDNVSIEGLIPDGLTLQSSTSSKSVDILKAGDSVELKYNLIKKNNTDNAITYKIGDVSNDGKITAADARLALRFSAQLEIPTTTQALAADIDGNNKITASDARKILRISANLDPAPETSTATTTETTTIVQQTTTVAEVQTTKQQTEITTIQKPTTTHQNETTTVIIPVTTTEHTTISPTTTTQPTTATTTEPTTVTTPDNQYDNEIPDGIQTLIDGEFTVNFSDDNGNGIPYEINGLSLSIVGIECQDGNIFVKTKFVDAGEYTSLVKMILGNKEELFLFTENERVYLSSSEICFSLMNLTDDETLKNEINKLLTVDTPLNYSQSKSTTDNDCYIFNFMNIDFAFECKNSNYYVTVNNTEYNCSISEKIEKWYCTTSGKRNADSIWETFTGNSSSNNLTDIAVNGKSVSVVPLNFTTTTDYLSVAPLALHNSAITTQNENQTKSNSSYFIILIGIVLAVMLIIALAVFILKNKIISKKIVLPVLCALIAVSVIVSITTFKTSASNTERKSFTVTKTITVDGSEYKISSNINYNSTTDDTESLDTWNYDVDDDHVVITDEYGNGYINNRIILFAENDDRQFIQSIVNNINGKIVGYSFGKYQIEIESKDIDEIKEICENLRKIDGIFSAFPEYTIRSKMSQSIPNDSWRDTVQGIFGTDWDEDNPSGLNWWLETIQAPSAWEYSSRFNNIRIGIVDGGFDVNHEDLNITVLNSDVNANDNKIIDDIIEGRQNHGTHVAGIIGATANNEIGITGIVWNTELFGVDVFATRSQESKNISLPSTYEAIEMLIRNNCKVINMSIGTTLSSDFESIYDKGSYAANCILWWKAQLNRDDFIIVQSAGNNGIDCVRNGWFCSITDDVLERYFNEEPEFCKDYTFDDVYDHIIIVGAVEKDGDSYQLCKKHYWSVNSFYSNYGDNVSITAPGYEIFSTILSGGADGSYGNSSGTSMATPMVAGVCSLVWSVNPEFSADEVKDIVCNSTSLTADSSSKNDSRIYPIVNAKLSVEEAIYRTDNEQKCKVSGTAKDSKTNNTIADVTVTAIISGSGGREYIAETTTTDENGIFTMNLTYGDYKLVFAHDNYEIYETSFTLDAKNNVLSEAILLMPKIENTDDFSEKYYSEVLSQYKEALENNFDSDSLGEYVNENIYPIPTELYYALYDVDCNGIPELFISTSHIWDIFTYANGKIHRFTDDASLGSLYYQNTVYVYKNGIILIQGHSGQASSYAFYKYSSADGFTPMLIDHISKGAMSSSLTFYYDEIADVEITEDEYTAVYEKYTSNEEVEFDWKLIEVQTTNTSNAKASGTCGTYLTWVLYDDGELVISGIGEMSNSLFSPWDSYDEYIKKVTIENGATSIGSGAFDECINLTEISIPNSVTSIGDSAFYNCKNLLTITLPDSVTTINYQAFKYCSSLSKIIISNNVTDIGDFAFDGCKSLTNIIIPNSVTSLGKGAFQDCIKLSSITIYNGITKINSKTFYNCSSLEEIIIPNSVDIIGSNAFENCTNLERVTLSTTLSKIELSAFAGCSSLISISIPKSVTWINYSAFKNCDSLVSITFLNPECTICYDIISNSATTVYGYSNSTAQKYAEKQNKKFISLD